MSEASIFFEGKGRVQETLRRITRKLNDLNIPYAVAGGMALYAHGHERFTEDVDILVTREGLRQIHERLDGLGYVRPFAHSKNLRDVESGVKIEFLLTGDYPGDGKPKDVAFPDPATVAESMHGVQFLSLPAFITLKLTSGMTGADRDKDLVDVQELVKAIRLGAAFAEKLAPSVRSKYLEICERLRKAARRYVNVERSLPREVIDAMLQDGVVQEANGRFVTTDPDIAAKHNMYPEDEIFEDEI